ncbi:MAG TPA: methyl-accepting chemotaxis protein [Burkholderiales bacterium]|nr:methyl-accepting chemotaxis protein [Burkholderiales bacterium]
MFLLRPGIAFIGTMGNGVKLPLLSALFTIPLVVISYYAYMHIPVPSLASWGIWGTWSLGVYFMVSFYFQAGAGWKVLTSAIQRISASDLTGSDSNTKLNAHFGHLMHGLDSVNKNLGQIVAQVRESANAVSTAANEAATENANLSQRTEQQAATLEETASGMEELAATVKQNADNCKKADDLAQNAATTARQGAQAVHQVVDSMTTIDRSSKQIVDIIGVIEGIAFQTNILALNAAVEAARAGEQGRGFVVVADEVRNLAQRSAGAAKEIKTLIETSVSQISDGGKHAQAAGKVIGDIVVSVQQVTELIGEIAAASNEQSAGVEEINRAVIQMENVTQQNAALVEEASASSVALQEQSERLAQLVSRFKLKEESVTARPSTPAASPPVRSPKTTAPKDVVKLVPRLSPVRKYYADASAHAAADDKWREF